jgi:hypothetical protein
MICPACIGSTAIVVVGVTSGGGALAYVVAWIRRIAGSRKVE